MVYLTVTLDINITPLGQGVDHRSADAMQAAGYHVGLAAEFSPGMKHGHYRFQGGYLGGGMNIYRDTAPVIRDAYGIILINCHNDTIAATGHGFIDAVISNLVYQVMKPALVGTPDVHAGTAPYGFTSTQYLDILSGIIVIISLFSCHDCPWCYRLLC